MKKFLFALMFLFLAMPVMAQEENGDTVNNYNTVEYYIDLGSGDGAIIIVGDGNTIFLPDKQDPVEFVPNQITISPDGQYINLVLMDTDLIIDGQTITYTKLVIRLSGMGWELLWWEQ